MDPWKMKTADLIGTQWDILYTLEFSKKASAELFRGELIRIINFI